MGRRIARILYYGLLSMLAGGPLGFLIWLVYSLCREPEAYWLFVLLSGIALGRPWVWVGMLACGGTGALVASLVLLRRPSRANPSAKVATPGCLIASTLLGAWAGGLIGGVFAAVLFTLTSLFVRLFLVGIDPSTLFNEYGGPLRAALGLVWTSGGLGAVLGLALGYVVGYTPTEIARLRRKWQG